MGLGILRRSPPRKASFGSTKTTPLPEGTHVIPTSVKVEYDALPVHVYHPTPYDAITILRHGKRAHEWLVAGWYLDTYRDSGVVKGLIYRMVESDRDKEVVLNELKKLDKEAIVKFGIEGR